MKAVLIVAVVVACGFVANVVRDAASAGTNTVDGRGLAPSPVIDVADEIGVEDRYLLPELPARVVDQLPAAEAAGDRYRAERIALADLVVSERILAAEDRATGYARELPGFTGVLLADGFRQDADGGWFYDPYASWMRLPLNR